jgi:hypothetical protein
MPIRRKDTLFRFECTEEDDNLVTVTLSPELVAPYVHFVGANVARLVKQDGTSSEALHAYRSFDDELIKLSMAGKDLAPSWGVERRGIVSYSVSGREHVTGDHKYFRDIVPEFDGSKVIPVSIYARAMFPAMGEHVHADVHDWSKPPPTPTPPPTPSPPPTPPPTPVERDVYSPKSTLQDRPDDAPGAPQRPQSQSVLARELGIGKRLEFERVPIDIQYLTNFEHWSSGSVKDWEQLNTEIKVNVSGHPAPCSYRVAFHDHAKRQRRIYTQDLAPGITDVSHVAHHAAAQPNLPPSFCFQLDGTWWVVRTFESVDAWRKCPRISTEPEFKPEHMSYKGRVWYAMPMAYAALTCLCLAEIDVPKLGARSPVQPAVALVRTMNVKEKVADGLKNFVDSVLDGSIHDSFVVTDPPRSTPRARPTVGRNDLCPCGSGKKFKKCCDKGKK